MGQEAQTLFYSGTFERSMDAKKRVAVPAIWLKQEEGEVFHVIGHPKESFLVVMPPAELEAQQRKIDLSDKLTESQKRIATRRLWGNAQRVLTDKQGRILLTDELCKHAKLENGIIFVGSNARFEIWSKPSIEQSAPSENEVFSEVSEIIGF